MLAKQPPSLEDFDWRTSVIVSSGRLESHDPVAVCQLSLRDSNGRVLQFELTAEQLDDAIEALTSLEKAASKEHECIQQAGGASHGETESAAA
jgi:hypothetical protein